MSKPPVMPTRTYTFTFPSLHDSTPLSGRIYHPQHLTASSSSSPLSSPNPGPSSNADADPKPPRRPPLAHEKSTQAIKGAIIAHPYAPLGGSYDDAVVLAIVDELLSSGWVVGTFNFRYVSGISLMIRFYDILYYAML